MIYINRSSVQKPSILDSEKAVREFEKMRSFYLEQDATSKYQRYKFASRLYTRGEVKETLKQLFHGKCAYCESLVSPESAFTDVDEFRPKGGSMNLDGSHDSNHYWWLAYEWNNLYHVCMVCNRQYKRNYFPVRDNIRAEVLGDLSVENPLLLDPCNKIDFEVQHIDFDNAKAIPLSEEGEITIKILGLNRSKLIATRSKELDQFEIMLHSGYNKRDETKGNFNHELANLIEEYLQPDSTYLACKWANYWEDILELTNLVIPEYLPFYKDKLGQHTRKGTSRPSSGKVTKKRRARTSYSLDKMKTEKARETYFGESRWIERVRISNFKIIEELELEFSKPKISNQDEFQQPWMALLGENGTGKSTVLQAIALTLAGEERINELNLNAAKFVNRNTEEKSGWVKVYLSDRKAPITLEFSKASTKFEITPKSPQIIVRGYGATRLFSNDLVKAKVEAEDRDFLFIKNLFNPLELLLDGNKWLLEKLADDVEKLPDDKLFPEIAKSLGDLLLLDEDQHFYPDKNEEGNPVICLKLYANKKGIPLEDLSAGYKAVLALGLDIMMGFGQMWPSIFDAQGIVLVDELGVHLHPRWKMTIVRALRKTFPGLNFVMATHEPLCLRGLNENEVILMRLDGNKDIEIITDLPSPKNMRVGQLLTSVFGLDTTMDPELEKLYSEYYQLQSIRKPSEEEKNRLEELSELLRDDFKEDPFTGGRRLGSLLGRDLNEMLEFEIIEQKIADYKTAEAKPKLKDLKKETLLEVQKLWKKKL